MLLLRVLGWFFFDATRFVAAQAGQFLSLGGKCAAKQAVAHSQRRRAGYRRLATAFGPVAAAMLLASFAHNPLGSGPTKSDATMSGSFTPVLNPSEAAAAIGSSMAILDAQDLPFDVHGAADGLDVTVGLVGFPRAVSPTTWEFMAETTWVLPGGRRFHTSGGGVADLSGELDLVEQVGPSLFEDSLTTGDALRVATTPARRGAIVDRNGFDVVSSVDVVRVGVVPSRLVDAEAAVAAVAAAVPEFDSEAAVEAIASAPHPDWFLPLAEMPRQEFNLVAHMLRPITGVVFEESLGQPVVRAPWIGSPIVGSAGPVTAEIMAESPGLYEPGQIVGLSGLQRSLNNSLAGRDGVTVYVVGGTRDGASTARRSRGGDDVIFRAPVQHGETAVLSVDSVLQQAAMDAVGSPEKTTSLVVVEPSTGHVLAVADGGPDAAGNQALTGAFPPGSIFKVVSGYSALEKGLELHDPVPCPAVFQIGDRSIRNYGGSALGLAPFETVFARSCNTAFVEMTDGDPQDSLQVAAAQFGIGEDFGMGVPVFSGSVPVGEGRSDFASMSFGQGRVLMSPFSAAVMAASAANGGFVTPRLVLNDPPVDGVAGLDARAADDLRGAMRAVVTEGTGRALANVAGGAVSGKTGSAEFGVGPVLDTHAWFVGFQGDMAVASFVRGGGGGGSVAAPVAARFFNLVSGDTDLDGVS